MGLKPFKNMCVLKHKTLVAYLLKHKTLVAFLALDDLILFKYYKTYQIC